MLSCLFAADFLFAWSEQSHSPTSPCLVILGMLEALLAPPWWRQVSGEVPALQLVSRSVRTSTTTQLLHVQQRGNTEPNVAPWAQRGGQLLAWKIVKTFFVLLLPPVWRRRQHHADGFASIFWSSLCVSPGKAGVCSKAVSCGCSSSSPLLMWVGLHQVIFPAMMTKLYFFPKTFQWQRRAVNVWWGEAAQPKVS